MDGSDDGDENEVEHNKDIFTVIRRVVGNQEEKIEKHEKEERNHTDDEDGDDVGGVDHDNVESELEDKEDILSVIRRVTAILEERKEEQDGGDADDETTTAVVMVTVEVMMTVRT